MINYEIREATNKDIPSLLELEQSFLAPWPRKYIEYELNVNPVNTFLVVTLMEKIVGFIDYWITYDSATISQIAILNEYRRQGLGTKLLQEMYDDCYAKKVRNITLEVRTNNKSAVLLYEKFGFKNVLVKPHYYDNGDDAYYMMLEVK